MMPWLIAGIVVLVLLGVGTAVHVATRGGQPTAKPSASAGKSGSAGPSGTATPRPSSSGEIIAPSNSGYKFPVPAGFHSVSDHNTPGAGSVAYQSVVRLNDATDQEYLQVTVYSMTVDTDSFTDAQLEKILTDVYDKLSVKYDGIQRTDISHIRAFRTEVTIGSLRGVIVSAFRGKWQLEVLCQWQSRETDIRRGCYSVLDSVEWSPSA